MTTDHHRRYRRRDPDVASADPVAPPVPAAREDDQVASTPARRRLPTGRALAVLLIVAAVFAAGVKVSGADALVVRAWHQGGDGSLQAIVPTATAVVVVHYHANVGAATSAPDTSAPETTAPDATATFACPSVPGAPGECAGGGSGLPPGFTSNATPPATYAAPTVCDLGCVATAYAGGVTGPTVNPVPPSPADCAWALNMLAEDAQLDTTSATIYPQWSGYFTTSATWWRSIAAELQASCTGGTITAGDCTAALSEIAEGWHSHKLDEQAPQPNAPSAWNEQWANNYTRLYGIVAGACRMTVPVITDAPEAPRPT